MNNNNNFENFQMNEFNPNDAEFSELDWIEPMPVADEASETMAEAEALNEAANEAIENGEYAAASHLKEEAEMLADEAGSIEPLDGPTSTELDQAAYHQAEAALHERDEAANAQAGDYEAARESALEAEANMQEADFIAGGDDHSGQAELEADQMDWAAFHQESANELASDAVEYAEDGNWDAAASSADAALAEQSTADLHGDLGEHGGDMAIDDPFSTTANDVGFENDAAFDYQTDTGMDYDTGSTFDYSSGSDFSSTTDFDSGLDTV